MTLRNPALKATHAAALACGGTGMSHAAITIDLAYVDPASNAYARFRNWVDQAVNGSPGYEFSANDAALMYRLSSQAQYCALAVDMVDEQVGEAEDRKS